MKNILNAVQRFASDEEGVTAIEYGLIAALIGVAAIGAMTSLGINLGTFFTGIGNKLHL